MIDVKVSKYKINCVADQFSFRNKCYNCNDSLHNVSKYAPGVSDARDCAFITYEMSTFYLGCGVFFLLYGMIMFFYLIRRQSNCDFLQVCHIIIKLSHSNINNNTKMKREYYLYTCSSGIYNN